VDHSEIIASAIEGVTSPIRLRRIAATGRLKSAKGEGDKADACDAACAMDHKISGAPKPIVEFLYICIIEARSGCV
jgi:hypothetical protein